MNCRVCGAGEGCFHAAGCIELEFQVAPALTLGHGNHEFVICENCGIPRARHLYKSRMDKKNPVLGRVQCPVCKHPPVAGKATVVEREPPPDEPLVPRRRDFGTFERAAHKDHLRPDEVVAVWVPYHDDAGTICTQLPVTQDPPIVSAEYGCSCFTPSGYDARKVRHKKCNMVPKR